jgi:hypothetical protein
MRLFWYADPFEFGVGVLVGTLLGICLFGLTLAIWKTASDSIVLSKTNWTCTNSTNKTHLQPMLVGKVTILMPMSHQVCVEYKKNQ